MRTINESFRKVRDGLKRAIKHARGEIRLPERKIMFRGGRFSPRLSGAGRQVVKQVLERGLLKVRLTPTLRAKIRDEFSCTNEDIDKGVQEGITEFGNDFKKMLAEQREMLTPPKENRDES